MTLGSTTLDEQMMRRCIELASTARSKGNTAVGALVVVDGQIVSDAEEQPSTGSSRFEHVEILAVIRASEKLGRQQIPEATLYTTAEPCFLCAYAIREARIGRVVIGSPTQHIGAATSQYPILLATDIAPWGAPPAVVHDVMKKECDEVKRKHAR